MIMVARGLLALAKILVDFLISLPLEFLTKLRLNLLCRDIVSRGMRQGTGLHTPTERADKLGNFERKIETILGMRLRRRQNGSDDRRDEVSKVSVTA